MIEDACYVYIYFDEVGIPFYVGCGIKDRADRWRSKSKRGRLNDKIEQVLAVLGEVPCIKVVEDMPSSKALIIERLLIRSIGINPIGPLLNSKHGRSGRGGAYPKDSTRKLISDAAKNQWTNPEYRKQYIETRKSRPLHPISSFNIAEANRRRRGQKLSLKTRQKISQARYAYWQKKREEGLND